MDNYKEFVAQVIIELKLIWPKMTIVYGKPQHPQSQGSAERASADVKDMLRNNYRLAYKKQITHLLSLESLDLIKENSLREINNLNSITGGQGF